MNDAAPITAPDGETDTGSGAKDEKKEETWGSFLRFLALLIAAMLILRIFIFSLFSIPSESMLPSLWNGDVLAAKKWSYGYSNASVPYGIPLIPGRFLVSEPDRGDVAIFKHPVDGTDYIKRVIGLPGDTVEMRDGQVILNGTAIPKQRIEDFIIPVSPNTDCAYGAVEEKNAEGDDVCRYARFRETLPSGLTYPVLDFGPTMKDNYGPVVVPEGRMFVMGDNRDNSQDSRYRATAGGGVGLVPLDNLVGEAVTVTWSFDGSGEWIKPWTWPGAIRLDRTGNGL